MCTVLTVVVMYARECVYTITTITHIRYQIEMLLVPTLHAAQYSVYRRHQK